MSSLDLNGMDTNRMSKVSGWNISVTLSFVAILTVSMCRGSSIENILRNRENGAAQNRPPDIFSPDGESKYRALNFSPWRENLKTNQTALSFCSNSRNGPQRLAPYKRSSGTHPPLAGVALLVHW